MRNCLKLLIYQRLFALERINCMSSLKAMPIKFNLKKIRKKRRKKIIKNQKIKVKRKKEDNIVIEDEQYDDSMNITLQQIEYETIFKGMYDKSICFEFDLTI